MTIVVRIAGAPPRNYYRDPAALPHVPAAEARHQLLRGIGPLRSGSDENANITVEFENRAGEASALLAGAPPVGAAVTITEAGVEVFAGTLQRIGLRVATATIELEA